MIESAYIDATQALSWIAFRDFGVISRTLSSQQTNLQKWQVSDMNTLLECLDALEQDQPWSLEQWRKESEYERAQLDLEHVKNVIRESGKSVSELNSELTREYDKIREVFFEAQKAGKTLIEYLSKEIFSLRSIRKNGDGYPETVPLGILRSPNLALDVWKNIFYGLDDWQYLEVARADILKHWPLRSEQEEPTDSGKVVAPLPRPCASEEAVRTWFSEERLPLHQTEDRHPSRNKDWKACQERFEEKARFEILSKVRRKCLEEHQITIKAGRPRKTG